MKWAALSLLIAASAAAQPDHSHDEVDTHSHDRGAGHSSHGNGWGNGHHKGEPAGVPELDKSVAASAAVLIGGGFLVLLGRRKK